MHPWHRLLQEREFRVPRGHHRWGFGRTALETKDMKQLSTLLGLPQTPSVGGLLRVEEQQVPMATMVAHLRQRHANRDSLIGIHELGHRLESQGVDVELGSVL